MQKDPTTTLGSTGAALAKPENMHFAILRPGNVTTKMRIRVVQIDPMTTAGRADAYLRISIADKNSEIMRAVCFNDDARTINALIAHNAVYDVSGFDYKENNKYGKSIIFNKNTTVECTSETEASHFPAGKAPPNGAFVTFSDIKDAYDGNIVSVRVRVKAVSDITAATVRATNRDTVKRELELADAYGMTCKMTIWGLSRDGDKLHDLHDKGEMPVVVIVNARVGTFDQAKNLSTVSGGGTQFEINPAGVDVPLFPEGHVPGTCLDITSSFNEAVSEPFGIRFDIVGVVTDVSQTGPFTTIIGEDKVFIDVTHDLYREASLGVEYGQVVFFPNAMLMRKTGTARENDFPSMQDIDMRKMPARGKYLLCGDVFKYNVDLGVPSNAQAKMAQVSSWWTTTGEGEYLLDSKPANPTPRTPPTNKRTREDGGTPARPSKKST